jgi:hypothetical protein
MRGRFRSNKFVKNHRVMVELCKPSIHVKTQLIFTGVAEKYQKKNTKQMNLVGLEHPWSHNETSTLTTLIAAHLHILEN